MRLLCEKRKDESNLSHVHTWATLPRSRDAYVEAEQTEKEVLVWFAPKLGSNSLGANRIIAPAFSGQGFERRGSRGFSGGDERAIEGMAEGTCRLYQEEEREVL